jgi:hypothetical protein
MQISAVSMRLSIGAAIADARWEGEPPARGYLYLDELYIEEVQPHWPDAAKAQGKWHLLLDRDEWITDDLETLERKLYDWAASEGYFQDNDSKIQGDAWQRQVQV